MSEVKRWSVETEDGFGIGYGVMDQADDGKYIKYEDYETLEAECDSCHEMLDNYVKMMDEQDKRLEEIRDMIEAATRTCCERPHEFYMCIDKLDWYKIERTAGVKE